MHQLISKKIIIYLFVFLILVSVNNNSFTKLTLPNINNIEISGLDLENSDIIKRYINNSNFKNIFFIEKIDIIKKINSLKIIESFSIFKNYPSTLKIEIKKTNFLARTKKGGSNYFIGSNGKLIEDNDSTSILPFVFGNLDVQEFIKFKNEIDRTNFKYNDILSLYFYKSKRWDIKTSKGYLIKLPKNDIKKYLNMFVQLEKELMFEETTVIDFRPKNQIILNEK
tara:strand:- start:253 stop:927 length:675 start_codon:yes stop_codon:yes gene_type:complete